MKRRERFLYNIFSRSLEGMPYKALRTRKFNNRFRLRNKARNMMPIYINIVRYLSNNGYLMQKQAKEMFTHVNSRNT